ncbi:MAG: hypothetical protein E7300_06830 [Lachnospiraceae bacterium]|nr:hypothetical protein [Lachnospiraceae bacterium]
MSNIRQMAPYRGQLIIKRSRIYMIFCKIVKIASMTVVERREKMKTGNNRKKFLNKNSLLENRLNKEVLEDGLAYIPCYVQNMEDIICKYSIRDCVSLSSEFTDYIVDFIECIPTDYPIVLEIYGSKFTEEQKKIIVDTIASDGDYALGRIIQENRHHRLVFGEMVIGTVISGILLALIGKYLDGIPQEFVYVLFWLFADSFVRYIFIERGDYRDKRIGAGRIASMKVEFVEDEDNSLGFLQQ